MLFKSEKKIIFTELNNTAKMIGGEIVLLEYYPKYFGNIIFHLKRNDKVYEYIVDRDEIYFNKQMVCNNSYVREEGKEPYQKLIEIVLITAT